MGRVSDYIEYNFFQMVDFGHINCVSIFDAAYHFSSFLFMEITISKKGLQGHGNKLPAFFASSILLFTVSLLFVNKIGLLTPQAVSSISELQFIPCHEAICWLLLDTSRGFLKLICHLTLFFTLLHRSGETVRGIISAQ